MIGVHTPEFSFEEDIDNVRRFVKEMGIQYPVAIDNDRAIWRGFANHYWPALYFLDAAGQVRDHHFGEGKYEQSETTIRELLADAGNRIDRPRVTVEAHGLEVGADWGSLRVARDLRRPSESGELCVSWWRGGEHPSDVRPSGASPPESVGSFRTMDGQGRSRRPQRCRRTDRVSISRA